MWERRTAGKCVAAEKWGRVALEKQTEGTKGRTRKTVSRKKLFREFKMPNDEHKVM